MYVSPTMDLDDLSACMGDIATIEQATKMRDLLCRDWPDFCINEIPQGDWNALLLAACDK